MNLSPIEIQVNTALDGRYPGVLININNAA